MGQKRKRDTTSNTAEATSLISTDNSTTDTLSKLSLQTTTSFQIIAGSYDRVLHGFRITISSVAHTIPIKEEQAKFTPLFLFQAHASSIRTLAISPSSSTSSTKRILATSSSDTKINLYHLHTRRTLGSLTTPSSSPVTSLSFPSKSTLVATDEAGYIHIFRTRDWSLLTTLHAPNPKPKNGIQPIGGVNDIAVHPSGKLALTVSRNERSIRMWNLMTGRKAGVLAFPNTIPRSITGIGDGLKVQWRKGDGYAVMFERGIVLFGKNSAVRGIIVLSPVSKLHQVVFLEVSLNGDEEEVCFVATEDGRVVVYMIPKMSREDDEKGEETQINPLLITAITPSSSMEKSRIKDLDILPHASLASNYHLTTANSSGVLRVYQLDFTKVKIIEGGKKQKIEPDGEKDVREVKSVGFVVMMGEYDTGRRITCLKMAEIEECIVEEVNGGEEDRSEDGDSEDDESESNDSEEGDED